MKAMILAAGLGTRLRPLTDDRPKALVELNGRTMLEIALSRLRMFGVGEVIVNVHHLAERVTDYLQANHNFGMRIEISHEETLLDTGGGLKKAAWFFQESPGQSDADVPFILHNVDVLSNIDLDRMQQAHIQNQALATLAVQDRETSRYLLFDAHQQICGRRASRTQPATTTAREKQSEALAFSGIHIISPRLLSRMTEEGAFSIIETYLRLAAEGERIQAFRADEYYWRDLGKPDSVAQAAQDLKQGIIHQ